MVFILRSCPILARQRFDPIDEEAGVPRDPVVEPACHLVAFVGMPIHVGDTLGAAVIAYRFDEATRDPGAPRLRTSV